MIRFVMLAIAIIAVVFTFGLSNGNSAADGVVTSSKTGNTYQTMETILADAVHIREQTSSAPSSTYYQSDNAAFPAAPVDSYAPNTAGPFTITAYTNSYGSPGIVVNDSVAHPSADLQGLPKYTAAGTKPTAKCGATDCTLLVVDEHFGRMAQ